jgi:hypothetical protein
MLYIELMFFYYVMLTNVTKFIRWNKIKFAENERAFTKYPLALYFAGIQLKAANTRIRWHTPTNLSHLRVISAGGTFLLIFHTLEDEQSMWQTYLACFELGPVTRKQSFHKYFISVKIIQSRYITGFVHVRTSQIQGLFKNIQGHVSANSSTKYWKEGVRNQ